MASLTLEFVRATLGPGGEELLEGFLISGQVLLEAVHRLFVTLTGLLPAKAAAAHGASTCGDMGVTGGLVAHPTAGFKVGEQGWGPRRYYRSQGWRARREGVWGCSVFVHSPSPITSYPLNEQLPRRW